MYIIGFSVYQKIRIPVIFNDITDIEDSLGTTDLSGIMWIYWLGKETSYPTSVTVTIPTGYTFAFMTSSQYGAGSSSIGCYLYSISNQTLTLNSSNGTGWMYNYIVAFRSDLVYSS